jgi:hypothetical protein
MALNDIFDFSFIRKNPDENKNVVDADKISPASGAVNMAREEIKRDMETSAQRRRGPSAAAESGASDNAVIRAEIEKQLEACYDPKAWAALLALPADAALTYTGREYWEISRDERETLGVTGAAAARTLMVTDPRGLAFLMVASALFSVYVPRGIQEMKFQRKQKDQPNEPPKS